MMKSRMEIRTQAEKDADYYSYTIHADCTCGHTLDDHDFPGEKCSKCDCKVFKLFNPKEQYDED